MNFMDWTYRFENIAVCERTVIVDRPCVLLLTRSSFGELMVSFAAEGRLQLSRLALDRRGGPPFAENICIPLPSPGALRFWVDCGAHSFVFEPFEVPT